MLKEIVADINPYQTRVALMEDWIPCEIYVERRGKERLVGNIYKGRVQNVLPGMQAAFVDIGLERNAFLYAGDIDTDVQYYELSDGAKPEIPNIKDIVKSGQAILVQVLKDPVGTKGARVTTHITLPGTSLVLMPTVDYIGVSRRVEEDAERVRLKRVISQIKPEGLGLIVRTAAEGKAKEDFIGDVEFLTKLWSRIQGKVSRVTAPRLVHAEEPLVFRVIRDIFTSDTDRLVVNDRKFYEKIRAIIGITFPVMLNRIILKDNENLFDEYGLENALNGVLSRKVWLKNGAYIVIDQTEALTTIDVNTGRFVGSDNLQETIAQTNCEAAGEIARQLRLRGIGGIIIIDFIDMYDPVDQGKVLNVLKTELQKDSVKSNVLGITQLGLVEMTRKKNRNGISDVLQMPCPYCGGDGKVLSRETTLLKLRKYLQRRLDEEDVPNYLVKIHPDIAGLVYENTTDQDCILPRRSGRNVWIQETPQAHIESFSIEAIPSIKELERVRRSAKLY